MRRLADLHFQVEGPTGHAQAGIAIELTSSEFGTSAEAWIEQGKLRTIPASTMTDAEGTLIFPAIPHGNYHWHLVAPTGEVLEGALYRCSTSLSLTSW